MRLGRLRLAVMGMACVVWAAGARASEPVRATVREGAIHLQNESLAVTVNASTGQVESMRLIPSNQEVLDPKGGLYWDANAESAAPPAGQTPPKKGYFRLPAAKDRARLVARDDGSGEVVVDGGPGAFFPFDVSYHYALRPGVRGLYAWVEVDHPTAAPGGTLWQTRFVLRTATDGTFTDWAVGPDKIYPKPTAAVVGKVMDATFKLADGSVKTKYQNSVYWAEATTYGVLGKAVGLWILSASTEYHNGGPVKQGQTVHDDVLLRVLQSVHFGAKPVVVAAGEAWRKVYGPFLIYANTGADEPSRWADAVRQQQAEAKQWPYAWVDSPGYVHARGTVVGTLRVGGRPAAGAWAILSEPGVDWALASKGYQFYTRTDAQGRFTLKNVIGGTYTLYASGADQPADFSRAGVQVSAAKTTDLGTLDWPPVRHGTTLWQIGTFDRSAGEFCDGDNARQYQMFLRYPKRFPNDVDFTIGKSDPKRDWNYAHWSWYVKHPAWTIHFTLQQPPREATLTVGIASAQPAKGGHTNVVVAVNGQELGRIALQKTGTAGYRGGTQDSPYHVLTFAVPRDALKAGENRVTFEHADAEQFKPVAEKPLDEGDDAPPGRGYPGQVMYDAIRLEGAE
ncbi:MAG: polysaccharide lyase family protein [Tepidisphaeraceae bacterium]